MSEEGRSTAPSRTRAPLAGASSPVVHNPILRRVSQLLLKLAGWRVTGEAPDIPKYILVGAPHTSNWDWVMMILVGAYLGVRPYWMGKKELFPWPVGGIMRRLRGIPIDRSGAHQLVEQMVRAFNEHEQFALVITPEGTRSWSPRWKTGFYHMAIGAGAPLVLAYIDYSKKEAGIGPTIYPTGDMEADLREIQAFYSGIKGKYPEDAGPVLPDPDAAQPE